MEGTVKEWQVKEWRKKYERLGNGMRDNLRRRKGWYVKGRQIKGVRGNWRES